MARKFSRRGGLTARERFWLGHMRKNTRAGIAAKTYAEREGLSFHALYQAKKRLVKLGAWPERKAGSASGVFAPVRVVEPSSLGAGCRLRIASGAVLEWSAALSPEVLAVLLDRMGAAR